jgi:hypothetical protein
VVFLLHISSQISCMCFCSSSYVLHALPVSSILFECKECKDRQMYKCDLCVHICFYLCYAKTNKCTNVTSVYVYAFTYVMQRQTNVQMWPLYAYMLLLMLCKDRQMYKCDLCIHICFYLCYAKTDKCTNVTSVYIYAFTYVMQRICRKYFKAWNCILKKFLTSLYYRT